jgi:hypothetical protein
MRRRILGNEEEDTYMCLVNHCICLMRRMIHTNEEEDTW